MTILSQTCVWTRKSQLRFGSLADPEFWSWLDLSWHRCVLSKCWLFFMFFF